MSSSRQKSKWKRFLFWLKFSSITFGIFAFFGLIAFVYFSWNLPSVNQLQTYRPSVGTAVYSSDHVKIGEFFREKRVFISLKQVPQQIIEAFLAAEDAGFYEHGGISITGITRAMFKNLLAGEMRQGGSTITQQVAKNLLLTPERSIDRKIKEAILALRIERYLSKEEIIEIYLNQIYLGDGAYGIEAAAQNYFGKSIHQLTLHETALLAGLTRAPSRDNPRKSTVRATQKRNYVLKRMLEEDFITKEDYDRSSKQSIKLAHELPLNERYAPYFVEHVRRYLMEKYGEELLLEEGLQVFTTVSSKAALASEKAIKEGIEKVDRHQGYRGPLKEIKEKDFEQEIENLKLMQEPPWKLKKTYQALVTKVDNKKNQVHIHLGNSKGIIPLKNMAWARKPNPALFWEYHKIKKVSQALSKGDVILVRHQEKNLFSLFQKPQVQGALLSIDPRNGSIRAMSGGYNFAESEFNRAIQARRQPGSSFKAVTFASALERGYTPASIIVDSPIVYDDPSINFEWKPKNYAGKFHGDTIFRDCLVQSRNIPTIKIVQDLGVEYVVSYAKKLGIQSPLDPNLSLALGASSITLLELVKAYSVFASGGKKMRSPLGVAKILDRDGNILERNVYKDFSTNLLEQTLASERLLAEENRYQEAEKIGTKIQEADPEDEPLELPKDYVISPQNAYIMTHLLNQVIESGTGSRAKAINRPAAGKTGTTNENHDAWFIGYTPEVVTAVWLGYDDATKSLGSREDGGRVASPIWLAFMQEYLKEIPKTEFRKPQGLVTAKIDRTTGRLASAATEKPLYEVFVAGTEPKLTSEEASATQDNPEDFFMQQ